jgi:magnesium transporter
MLVEYRKQSVIYTHLNTMKGWFIMQHTLVWRNGTLTPDLPLETLQDTLNDPQALVWLDIEGDPGTYADTLSHLFKLSHITIQTIGEEHERAKFFEGNDYFYMVVHGLTYDTKTEEAGTPKLDIVFAQNFVVTVHRAPLDWLVTLRQAIINEKGEENTMARGMASLLYTILDTLVDSYFPVLDTLDDLIDELEDETVNSAQQGVQLRLFRIKRAMALMRRVISPQIEVANSLISRTGSIIPAKAEPYFADVHDHLIRAFEILDSYRDLMSGLLDVYLSTVSNRLNQVMKQLTIIATIFMPITFITGVFGQNFAHSPQVEHDNGYNFWIVLAFMALITLVQIWYFRRRGWLGD